jgi:UDP-N-acetylglucosamine:LPS N-acetylglucosamine transferase
MRFRSPFTRSYRRVVPEGQAYRILFVCSSGGHLSHFIELRSWWEQHERAWVTFDKPDAITRLAGERVIWGHHPTTRNIPNLLRNIALAPRVLRAERPDVIVSDGAGIAVPFFWIGRALGIRSVFLEVYDRVDSATMTGKLVEPVADLMLVQWPEQRGLYRDPEVVGTVW